MRKIVDIHCHFLNFDYIPDNYTIHLINNIIGRFARLFKERDFRNPSFPVRFIIKVVDLVFIKYLIELLNSFRILNFTQNPEVIDTLMKKGEYFTAGDMEKVDSQNPKTELILCTPLMMDFVKAAKMKTPTTAQGVIPFKDQIKEHAFFSARYPWQIMPFFHFHPERKCVMKSFRDAIEKKGFIGVKLYPAMGYYPDWRKNKYERVRKNLHDLYTYIRARKFGYIIPITVHSQNNSTQAIGMRTHETHEFTRISNWSGMIKEYGLKINFAHYGGPEFLDKKNSIEKKFSNTCRQTIRSLMKEHNNSTKKHIFADISAQTLIKPFFTDRATHEAMKSEYFKQLNTDLADNTRLIMFGTDLPAITPVTLNKDFIDKYEVNLNDQVKDNFFKFNAYDFLFENREIPQNYIEYLGANCKNDPFGDRALPGHIKEIIPKKKYIAV